MISLVRLRLILSFVATISASFAPMCVVHADEPAASTSAESAGLNSETDEQCFLRHKAEGDRALAEKRLNDAIKAYRQKCLAPLPAEPSSRLQIADTWFCLRPLDPSDA